MPDAGTAALRWVVTEIGVALETAMAALDAYLQNPADHHQLQFCQAHLHEVTGSLTLAENRGGVLIAEAMEEVAAALARGAIVTPDLAAEAMTLAAAVLPDYLQRCLAANEEPLPILIDCLNHLRVLARQPLASEGGLFTPELSPFEARSQWLPPSQNRGELAALCRKLRLIYQHALLALTKGDQVERQRELLTKVGQRMCELFPDSRRQLLWEVYAQLLGNLNPTAPLGITQRHLLWQLDRDLRLCGEITDADSEQPPVPRELFKNLLYYATKGEQAGAHRLRECFRLDATSTEFQRGTQGEGVARQVREALGRELLLELSTLRQQGGWAREDITAIGSAATGSAVAMAPALRRLRDTLVGAGLERSVAVADQLALSLDNLHLTTDAQVMATAGREWADALETLERLIESWVAMGEEASDPETLRSLLVDEARQTALISMRGLLDELKEAVIGLAAAREDSARLDAVSGPLRELRQVSALMGPELLENTLTKCECWLDQLRQAGAIPSWAGVDLLADCLAAIEEHLELLASNAGRSTEEDSALAQACQCAQQLQHHLPSDPSESPVAAARNHLPGDSTESESHGGALSAAEAATKSRLPMEEEVDPEIRDIFIEEAREVLASLLCLDRGGSSSPAPDLQELRRGFHTLKGSGRMVGATAISELGWAIENLLNRLREDEISWSEGVREVIDQALSQLPELIADFAQGRSATPPTCVALCERATALAAGVPAEVAGLERPPEAGAGLEAGPAPPGLAEQDPLAGVGAEALIHIETLERFVAACREGVAKRDDEGAARALHTLIGCCERVGEQRLGRILRRLEALVTARAERGQTLGTDLADAIAELTGVVHAWLRGSTELMSGVDALETRVDSLWDESGSSPSRTDLRALMADGLTELLGVSSWVEQNIEGPLPPQRLGPLLPELRALAVAADAAGLATLADLAGQLQRSGQHLLDHQTNLSQIDCYRQGLGVLLTMLDAVAAALPPPQITADLRAALASIPPSPSSSVTSENLPAMAEVPRLPLDDVEVTGELLEIFLEEAAELCEQIEQVIASWREGQEEAGQWDLLKRCLHTLKGSARMAGCVALGELCHDFETLVLTAETEAKPANFADICLAWYDRIERERERIARYPANAPADEPAATEGDRSCTDLPTFVAAPVTPSAPVVPPAPAGSARTGAPGAREPVPEDTTGSLGVAAPPTGMAPTLPPWRRQPFLPSRRAEPLSFGDDGPRETVKVPAPILDSLINLADEACVNRSRVEQQVQQHHLLLEEIEATVARLKDQVRRLGMETEAQILFRHEQLTQEGSEEQFDPLEMDRYSTLQQLSRALEESASDLQDLKETLLAGVRETEVMLIQQRRVSRDLQETLSLARMVPFSRVVPRLRRIVRQTSSELGKPVELVLKNIEGELDRSVLERVVPSLEHLIRNAIDHGIEPPQEREHAGKPAAGQVSVTFSREAGDVVIRLADDGRGLNLAAIRDKAVRLSLISEEQPIDEQQLTQLIFHPGFSTSTTVSQISGRGIGMDVVSSELRQLGGSITPLSRAGQGTEFILRVPFTISVNRSLLMKAGRERYGALVNTVAGAVRLDAGQLAALLEDPGAGFVDRGERYRVCRLEELVGSRDSPRPPVAGVASLVLIKAHGEQTAVLVEALEPSQEVVVKSLGPQFAKVRGLSGATILGDGQVVPILDLAALIRDRVENWPEELSGAQLPADPGVIEGQMKTVLVVDDSVTMRKAAARLLERQGYRVATARDGVEAMQFLQEVKPDLMLLDIEMPRMDGFEVARQVRGTARFAGLPIIMITSRSGDKHRNRARVLGVDHYVGKPYQEEHLLTLIESCLPAARSIGNSGMASPPEPTASQQEKQRNQKPAAGDCDPTEAGRD